MELLRSLKVNLNSTQNKFIYAGLGAIKKFFDPQIIEEVIKAPSSIQFDFIWSYPTMLG
ncbi:hypothetical protein Lsan_3467 [Legionella santicrucis]|uniref:Uncharacterized protein n=1 Tax=Legionella santicrucis TaxID=45074 RepID=A0A0W0YD96_9GAMM|nr:hypothetical protein Lsan_3467 [Legionella santicrucis]